MNMLVATAAVALLATASGAQAHDFSGFSLSASLGSESIRSSGNGIYGPMNDRLTGAVFNAGVSYTFQVGRVVLGPEADLTVGNVNASSSQDDGFGDIITETNKTHGSAALGVVVGFQLSRNLLVSADAGFTASDYEHGYTFSSPGSPNYVYKQTAFRAGPYYGVSAEYAFNDVSVKAGWRGFNQTEFRESDNHNWVSSAKARQHRLLGPEPQVLGGPFYQYIFKRSERAVSSLRRPILLYTGGIIYPYQ